MSKEILLRTLSAVALSAALAPAIAHAKKTPVTTLNGGGATQEQGLYAGPNNPNTGAPQSELSLWNSTTEKATFGTYWGSGSGTGQQAFIQNDLTCDINKVQNGGKCSNTPGGANAVHYGTSDTVLSATQVATWATSSWGQSAAGNLIQIPTLGSSSAIVTNDTNITSNGQLQLSDNDLCGIFSGLITDFSQLTDTGSFKPASGGIQLVYRTDSAGATFILTNHLAAVCNSGNSKAGVTFTATSTFSSLFAGNVAATIPNSIGEALSSGEADYLAGLSNGPVPKAIGYVSPDWTSLVTTSPNVLSNGLPSPLLVGAVYVGATAFLPTVKNITAALVHVKLGTNLSPPSNATDGANPLKWVPTVQTVTTGYPIVGYNSFDLAQCYQSATNLAGIKAFLLKHYTAAPYKSIQTNNGFTAIPNSGTAKFIAAIQASILKNTKGWNVDLGDKTACAGLVGR